MQGRKRRSSDNCVGRRSAGGVLAASPAGQACSTSALPLSCVNTLWRGPGPPAGGAPASCKSQKRRGTWLSLHPWTEHTVPAKILLSGNIPSTLSSPWACHSLIPGLFLWPGGGEACCANHPDPGLVKAPPRHQSFPPGLVFNPFSTSHPCDYTAEDG